ncbi:peptidase [Halobacillus litoralis]|uniref:Peptidase n=1 Tax=Halobacillus litoralis TaxID=45668 RepID=A0A845DR04_9BACI|nr:MULTISPECIES: C40 family peptidase [Halobacillus]MYL18975.1 peptidase [Halobacillus litoralis]MYL31083.1 peptidase [Halobacillus halophilus]MYL39392.1 peptidase [Halobacillus litoralis]
MIKKKAIDTVWVVAVPVATVWTAPDSPRDCDEPGISSVSSMIEWLDQLDHKQKLALCDDNLVQSQLLYGEEVIVDEMKDGWARIIIPHQSSKKDDRGYPGYIPERQLNALPQSKWQGNGMLVVHDKQTMLLDEKRQPFLEVSYLTSLPVIQEEGVLIKVRTPHGEGYISAEAASVYPSPEEIPKGSGAAIIESAETFLDLPYFWGGMSSYGFDCSGFAYALHKAHGYMIPRDATDQVNRGVDIPIDQKQPGDLLFFAYEEGQGRVHHVGFYYGEGKMLHSPNVGKNIEIIDLRGTIYEKELCAVRRYWEEAEEAG